MFPALVGNLSLYETESSELYLACLMAVRVNSFLYFENNYLATKNLVFSPMSGVTVTALLSAYIPVVLDPATADANASPEAVTKLAISLASLYFSRCTCRSSVMAAP